MKIYLALFGLMILNSMAAAGSVVISEVLYDPMSTESGGEFVELYNTGDSYIDIGGWAIATETSETDAVMPEGTIIPPDGYYLIADSGWDSSKDSEDWPPSDHEEPITMSNSNAGVALKDAGGNIMDAVGWGDPASIDEGLSEGDPHEGTAPGFSISRAEGIDTTDNSADFSESIPSPRNSNHIDGAENSSMVRIYATVIDEGIAISNITVQDDDNLTQGFQVTPLPGKNRTIRVRAVITGPAGNLDANVTVTAGSSTSVMAVVSNISSESFLYEGSLSFAYYEQPGTYTAVIHGISNSTASSDFEYLSISAVSIDSPKLNFSHIYPGSASELPGDSDPKTSGRATVQNIGNTIINLGVSSGGLSSGSDIISPGNIKYSLSGEWFALSQTPHISDTAIGLRSTVPLSFRLYIPHGTSPGEYGGAVLAAAVPG